MDTTTQIIEPTTEQVLLAKTFSEALPSLACAVCSGRKMHASPFSRYYSSVDLVPTPTVTRSQSLAVQFTEVLTLVCDQCGHLMLFAKHKVDAVVRRHLDRQAEPPSASTADPATTEEDPK